MKQLYRCNYCLFTGIEKDVAKHEAKCPFNPEYKFCASCRHYETSTCDLTGKYKNERDTCEKWEEAK